MAARFCGRCGSKVDEGEQFCGECGAVAAAVPVTPLHAPSRPQIPVAAPVKASSSMSLLGIAFAGALVGLIAVGGWTLYQRYAASGDQGSTSVAAVPQQPVAQPAPVVVEQAPPPPPLQVEPPAQQAEVQRQPPAIPREQPVRAAPNSYYQPPAPTTPLRSFPEPAIPGPPPIPGAPPSGTIPGSGSIPSNPPPFMPPGVSNNAAATRPSDPAPPPFQPSIPQPPAGRVEVTRAPGYRGPMSGVINWSGQLEKNGTVTIDGDAATSGTVRGSLPGVPVIIDLDAKEFALAESPSPSNGWTRMTIRSKNKKQVVITVNWKVMISQ